MAVLGLFSLMGIVVQSVARGPEVLATPLWLGLTALACVFLVGAWRTREPASREMLVWTHLLTALYVAAGLLRLALDLKRSVESWPITAVKVVIWVAIASRLWAGARAARELQRHAEDSSTGTDD